MCRDSGLILYSRTWQHFGCSLKKIHIATTKFIFGSQLNIATSLHMCKSKKVKLSNIQKMLKTNNFHTGLHICRCSPQPRARFLTQNSVPELAKPYLSLLLSYEICKIVSVTKWPGSGQALSVQEHFLWGSLRPFPAYLLQVAVVSVLGNIVIISPPYH
jgi:hypothetical protein